MFSLHFDKVLLGFIFYIYLRIITSSEAQVRVERR